MKKLFVFALFLAFCVPIYAQTVEVSIIENWNSNSSNPESSSIKVLEGVLDTFFSRGIISVEFPILQGDKENYESFKLRKNAKDSYIDYELVIFVDYSKNSIPDCFYKVYKVSTNSEVKSGKYLFDGKTLSSKNEINKKCISIGNNVASICIKILTEISYWGSYEKIKA